MQEINLYHLISYYIKRWGVIAVITILGALIGIVYTRYIQTPLYKSDATLLIIDSQSSQDQKLINNYIELLKSRRVLEPVIGDQGNNTTYDKLSKSVTATNEKNTEVIKLSVSSEDASRSTAYTEGILVSFKEQIKNLYNKDNISIVDNASWANKPYNVKVPIQIGLATSGGFILAIVMLFFIYDINLMKESAKANNKNNLLEESEKRKQKEEKTPNRLTQAFYKLIGVDNQVVTVIQNKQRATAAKVAPNKSNVIKTKAKAKIKNAGTTSSKSKNISTKVSPKEDVEVKEKDKIPAKTKPTTKAKKKKSTKKSVEPISSAEQKM